MDKQRTFITVAFEKTIEHYANVFENVYISTPQKIRLHEASQQIVEIFCPMNVYIIDVALKEKTLFFEPLLIFVSTHC